MSKSTKKRTNKHSRKNTGRGQKTLPPLRHTKRTASASPIRSRSRTKSRIRTLAQSIKSTRKNVQINTPENEIYEYSLGSSEKEFKKATPIKGIKKCNNPVDEDDFPCKMKRTIFRTKTEYNNYKKLKKQRNESTEHKSRSQHYDDIESLLIEQGYDLVRK